MSYKSIETPSLIETGKGLSVVYKNRSLYSKHNPDKAAKHLLKNIDLKENTLYITPSPILFKSSSEIENRIPESSSILYLEADTALAEFSSSYYKSKFPYLRVSDLSALITSAENLNITSYRKVELLITTSGYSLNKKFYDETLHMFQYQISTFWKNKMTTLFMSRMWISNIFLNTAVNKITFDLENMSINKPVLIAAAGPSLQSQLKKIKTYKERLFILAVDTALPSLIQSGIIPDAVVAVDCQNYNLYDFIDSYTFKDIILFYDITGNFRIHKYFNGMKIPFLSQFTELQFLKELKNSSLSPPAIPPLGSVGLTALYIAGKISKMKTGFIGLDFAFPLGKPHCSGTESAKRKQMKLSRIKSSDYTNINIDRKCRVYPELNPSLRSDPVLHTYAEHCKELLEKNEYYDCGTQGLLNHSKKTDITDLCEDFSESKYKPQFTGLPVNFSKIIYYLETQINILNIIINEIEKTDFKWSEKIKNLLKNNDYITVDFPDQNIFLVESNKIMYRIYTSAVKYKKTIKKALVIAFKNT